MKKIFFVISIFFLFVPHYTFAESSYVLPYPSSMPGNVFYKVNLVKNEILKYWYFGDFGKFKYNLKQSDKHLVEAKTLFEYKQYLLGADALKKSDYYFLNTLEALEKTDQDKDISELKGIFYEASQKHVEELIEMKNDLPDEFLWVPEKEEATNIDFVELLEESIKIRNE
jgi:hypothetical protein